jgi:4-amino-4-deoxy-L-arabinose transferase-like glycosyltransferase
MAEPCVYDRREMATPELKGNRILLLLGLIFILGTVARVACFVAPHGAIEPEGGEYARIAQNLRNGTGYVGIETPGPQLGFPPLFPVLIAVASYVTPDYEFAGRLVSLVLGAFLPLAVYGVAAWLVPWRTAMIAAAISAIHPLFVQLSSTVFAEGSYATLLLLAVYLSLRAFDNASLVCWAAMGGAFGAAFLIRQEAILPLGIAVLFGLTGCGMLSVRLQRSLVAAGVFLICTTPQMFLLYSSTGTIRFEGKSAINSVLGNEVLSKSGSQFEEGICRASYGINEQLQPTGVFMRANAEIIREHRVTLRQRVSYFREAILRNTPTLFGHLRSAWLGAPFLPALAVLGTMRRTWRRSVARRHMFVLLVPATTVATTFAVVHAVYPRYYFNLVPFLLIWAAAGLTELIRWTNRNFATILGTRTVIIPGILVAGFVTTAMIGYSLQGTRNLFLFREGGTESQPIEDAGVWIGRQQDARTTVMDVLNPVAFHANADYLHFPCCSAALATRFIENTKTEYIVLRRSFQSGRYPGDYYATWLASGIPDSRAQVAYVTPGDNSNGVVVYRWRHSGADSPKDTN